MPEVVISNLRLAFGSQSTPVYLFGTVGLGKSFAAAMVYSWWQGPSVTWIRYADLISTSIKADKDGSISRTVANGQVVDMTASQWWSWLEQVSLLVIDEIGTGTDHVWRLEMLWKVLEIRKTKPLLMTGNLSLKGLVDQFDARIQSRILAGTAIEMIGQDRRLTDVQQRIHRVQV